MKKKVNEEVLEQVEKVEEKVEQVEKKLEIVVFSHRICEIIITEVGAKHLKNIRYLPVDETHPKVKKLYIFRDIPEVREIFEKYAYHKG